MSEGNDIRDFNIREGEPEERVVDQEEAQVMAEAGDEDRSTAARIRQKIKNVENVSFATGLESNARAIEYNAEALELAAQKIHRHPELIKAKKPTTPWHDELDMGDLDSKALCKIQDRLGAYEEYNEELDRTIQEVRQHPVRIDYVNYYRATIESYLFSREERVEYIKKVEDLLGSDDTTLGDLKNAFIDGVLRKLQSRALEIVKSHKEYLDQFN